MFHGELDGLAWEYAMGSATAADHPIQRRCVSITSKGAALLALR
jgi:hypothetical protein